MPTSENIVFHLLEEQDPEEYDPLHVDLRRDDLLSIIDKDIQLEISSEFLKLSNPRIECIYIEDDKMIIV